MNASRLVRSLWDQADIAEFMEAQRKFWNQQQQALRAALSTAGEHRQAIELFLGQHAMVHSARLDPLAACSFEDEVWAGADEAALRRIPPGGEHSIAWIIWHIARIEDVTMNLLVAGTAQKLHSENWPERMNWTAVSTGNAMDGAGVRELSASMDLGALRAYRHAVGDRTRQVVQQLRPEELSQKVTASRLQRVMEEGAVIEAARGLIDYWGGLTIAGLLLMPPTRHNFVHLNEAARIKRKNKSAKAGNSDA
jgi:hypothetical protein